MIDSLVKHRLLVVHLRIMNSFAATNSRGYISARYLSRMCTFICVSEH